MKLVKTQVSPAKPGGCRIVWIEKEYLSEKLGLTLTATDDTTPPMIAAKAKDGRLFYHKV